MQTSAGCQEEIPSGRQKGAVFLQGMSSREKFCSSGRTSTVAKLLPPISPVLPPPFLLYFSHLELQPFPWGPPQPWRRRAVWLGEGSFTIRLITKEGVHSLTHESHNRRPYALWAGVHTRPQHTLLSPAPSCRPHFSLPCVPLRPTPAQPCCTDSCPLLLSSCLNPTKCLSKCPES